MDSGSAVAFGGRLLHFFVYACKEKRYKNWVTENFTKNFRAEKGKKQETGAGERGKFKIIL